MNSAAFRNFIDAHTKIIIIQADNPDGDSLATALALENILGRIGKEIVLYCGVDIPTYLRYMDGWDRVVHEIPSDFEASIIVDTSALTLLETLQASGQLAWVKSKPCMVLDHHQTEETITFANPLINEDAISSGELVYLLSKNAGLSMDVHSCEFIAYSILSDSLGLTTESVSPRTFHIMGELLEHGVSIAKLDDARRALSKKSLRITAYKGRLLQRIEIFDDPRVAVITIPWEEIEQYSHEYNPSMLVIDEMRMIDKVCVAIAFKTYPDGKITAKIRSNYGYKIAADIAEHFGGGGHAYAAGFKLQNKRKLDEVKTECLEVASKLLGDYREESNEVVQYTF